MGEGILEKESGQKGCPLGYNHSGVSGWAVRTVLADGF